MHPECPDYDLCENCEAFPIAVHPSNHPMLKMKTPDTVIPTVYRVGQTSLIEPATVVNEHQTSINTSRSPDCTPSGSAHKAPQPAATPMVPVHANIPVPPPAHAGSSFPVEDDMMRSCTPVARSFFDHVVFEKAEARLNQAEQRSVPSPGPPKFIAEFSGPFVPVPPRSPGLAEPVSFKPLEQPAATPPRNSPFFTPPPATVELPQAIPSPVERPSTLESQDSRPSANDPLPSWASLTPDVSLLVREIPEPSTESRPAYVASEPPSAVGSPLSSQALLKRPASGSPYLRSLEELVQQLPSLVPSKFPSLDKLGHGALSAKFVEDVTVSEGQTFPPGAEFVKCWRLLNNGERDWPENTELVFLAGDPLSDSALPPALVGHVAAGAEFDVWTGELKVCLTDNLFIE